MLKLAELEQVRSNRVGVMVDRNTTGWVSRPDFEAVTRPTDPSAGPSRTALTVFDDACSVIAYYLYVPSGGASGGSWFGKVVRRQTFEAPGFDPVATPPPSSSSELTPPDADLPGGCPMAIVPTGQAQPG